MNILSHGSNDPFIRDQTANDWECPATICAEVMEENPESSRQDILNMLYKLFEEKLIQVKVVKEIDLNQLLSEPEDNFDTKFWSGLTQKGCQEWEQNAVKMINEPISWDKSWSGNISY